MPHFTTGIGWALRLGLHCLQQAQRHLDEPGVHRRFDDADWVQESPHRAEGPRPCSCQGQALTLKQVEVIGLRLGETWNSARVNTVLRFSSAVGGPRTVE